METLKAKTEGNPIEETAAISAEKKFSPVCPICSAAMKFHLKGRDWLYKTTDAEFDVYKCRGCGLEQILPQPSFGEIKSFYPQTYYSYDTDSEKKGLLTALREKIIEVSYQKDAKKDILYYLSFLVKGLFYGLPLKPMGGNNFLDIGCGDGYNLKVMSRYGWNTYGFEIGEKGRKDNIYYDTDISQVDFGQAKFDFIRIWHVLEHVRDPLAFMEKVSSLVSDNGIICIGIPNAGSLYAKLFGRYWYNRDIPRHLVNYNPRNAARLCEKFGLKVVRTEHQSSGGLLGSLQHFINARFHTNYNLINRIYLFLLFYPIDILTNWLKKGDCIALLVKPGKFSK